MKLCALSVSAVKWIVVMAVLPARAVWAADESAVAAAEGAPLSNQVAVIVQWRAPVAQGTAYVPLDIFLTHRGGDTVRFETINFDAAGQTNVAWSQFYPSGDLTPGGTIAARVNWSYAPWRTQTVTLAAADGRTLSVPLSAWRRPERELLGISFTTNFSRMFALYRPKTVTPRRVEVNGVEVKDYRRCRSADPADVEMLALTPPMALWTGRAVALRIQYKDGTWLCGVTRAFAGVMRDAYLVKTAAERETLALDAAPPVVGFTNALFGDVGCYDMRMKRIGAGVEPLIRERLQGYAETPDKFLMLHYCTAQHTGLWDLYGPLADMAAGNPYTFSYGQDASRWLEDEEARLDWCARAARPSPWLWIPDAFQRRARFVEPDELRTLAWVMLAKGCDGFKYFAFHRVSQTQAGFEDCPPLRDTIVDLNKTIALKQERLAPLLPVSQEFVGGPRGVKVYTAWSGDRGLLALVRNLDYTTDGDADFQDGKLVPRFHANAKTNVAVTLSVPDWLQHDGVKDFLSDEQYASATSAQGLEVIIPQLDVFKLLWLENMAAAADERMEHGAKGVELGVKSEEHGAKSVEHGVSDNGQRATDNRQLGEDGQPSTANRLLFLCVIGVGVLLVAVWAMRRRK